MDYQIAIPTFRREKTIVDKTLALLARHDIDPQIVTVFPNDDEMDGYQHLVDAGYAGHIVGGPKGIGKKRNFINKHYPVGTYVLSVDDDISEIVVAKSRKELQCMSNLADFAALAFETIVCLGAKMWGVYPAPNPYFMYAQPEMSVKLSFVIACLYGFVAGEESLMVDIDNKEDYERSIKHYLAYGTVPRFNHVSMKTRCYREPGGLQGAGRAEAEAIGVRYLVRKYNSFCYRKNGREYPEIGLRDNRK